MTRNEALQIVTETINAVSLDCFNDTQRAKVADALNIVANMREKLNAPKSSKSEDSKNREILKRKNERAVAVAPILPIVTVAMTGKGDMTAQEVYDACASAIPSDWTKSKIVALFNRELKAEVEVTERKGKPNLYRLK